jgi:16S rRNA A1518/A1519 N6-dimethyltransferase RsmA/KsgA/DIM1 with predicted DNA glycosylase/AP lyase activity
LTIPEYRLLMEAVRLKQVDLDYRNHLQAFLNFAVKAEKKAGKNKTKPVYTSFNKFYDYEKEIDKAKGKQHEKGRFLGLSRYLKKREK